MSKYYSDEAARRAECPSCVQKQRVDTLFERIDHWDDNDAEIQGVNEFYVLQCRGCETVFFSRCRSNSEDYFHNFDPRSGIEEIEYPYQVEIWPKPYKPKTRRIPHFPLFLENERIANLLRGFYKAIDEDLRVLAAIGARTVFDSASEFLGVKPSLPFEAKLEELRKKGSISGEEKGALGILIDAGSAAAHRGWEPSVTDLESIAEILNGFLEKAFLQPSKLKKLKENVPKKPSNP